MKTLLKLLIISALLIIPAAAQAAPGPSFGSIDSVDSAKAFFHVSGDSLPTNQYATVPRSISGPDNVKADQLSVVICAQTGSDGSGQCSQSSSDAHVFKLSQLHHEDLGGGEDFWDYSFTASGNNTLRFLYRKNPGQASHWGLVYGNTDNNVDFSENKVVGLHDFDGTDLAKNILEPQANAAGLAWAKQGGVQTSENQTSLLQRSTNDPFMQAVGKVTEAVNSLNDTVSQALLWAVQTSNPNSVPGLADAWKTIRDLVNILFMLILVTLSVMTIARIDAQKYNVRSLLPMLVFAVITVNFSFLFATIMVNTAYVLSQPFLASALEVIKHAGQLGAGFGQNADSFGTAIVMLLASLLLLAALAVLLFFFIIRIIVIWLLAAMSPIVCLFMVLPLTRGEGTKLLQSAVRWVYMAPISFLILYVGSQVAFPTSGQNQTVDALLSALFYGGLIVAAVIIPIGLGGQVMRMAAGHGSRAAKLGGKGGLGIASALPVGGGMTAGEALRTGRGYMKLRKDAQEQRGLERAAGWQSAIHDSLGDSGIAKSLTGRDATQASTVTEGLVDERMKRLDSIGFQDPDYRQTMGYIMAPQSEKARLAGSMSADQLEQAQSRVGQLATAKALAKNGWWDDDIARKFGDTGYQKFAESDPAMRHLKRKHYGAGHQFSTNDFDTLGFALSMSSIDGDGLRKIQTPFWDYINPNSQASQAMPGASQMVRQMLSDGGLEGKRFNYNALRQNVNARQRNSAPDAKRAKHAANYQYYGKTAQRAVLSGMLDSRADRFMPVAGGPGSYREAEQQKPADYVPEG